MPVQLTAEVVTEQTSVHVMPTLDALGREGARRMLAAVLELEVAEYVAGHAESRGTDGLRQVRSGRAASREVVIGGLAVPVQAPQVDDRWAREQFTSQILPPYLRRSPRLDQALPVLYLRGLSTGDFVSALEKLLGEAVRDFSATNTVRLNEGWEAEYREEWAREQLACLREGSQHLFLVAHEERQALCPARRHVGLGLST